jgi:hypothetical protein
MPQAVKIASLLAFELLQIACCVAVPCILKVRVTSRHMCVFSLSMRNSVGADFDCRKNEIADL